MSEAHNILLKHKDFLIIWETNKSMSDPSTGVMQELAAAVQMINPSYQIDKACSSCWADMLNKAVIYLKEVEPTFMKFPKNNV